MDPNKCHKCWKSIPHLMSLEGKHLESCPHCGASMKERWLKENDRFQASMFTGKPPFALVLMLGMIVLFALMRLLRKGNTLETEGPWILAFSGLLFVIFGLVYLSVRKDIPKKKEPAKSKKTAKRKKRKKRK